MLSSLTHRTLQIDFVTLSKLHSKHKTNHTRREVQDVFGSWRYVWPRMKCRYITYPLGAMYPQFKTADLNIKWQWLWNAMVCPSERVVTVLYSTIHRYIVVVVVVVTNSKPAEISTLSYCCYKNNYWIRIMTSVKETISVLRVTSFLHTNTARWKPALYNNPTKHDDSTRNSIHYQYQTPTANRSKCLQLIITT